MKIFKGTTAMAFTPVSSNANAMHFSCKCRKVQEKFGSQALIAKINFYMLALGMYIGFISQNYERVKFELDLCLTIPIYTAQFTWLQVSSVYSTTTIMTTQAVASFHLA